MFLKQSEKSILIFNCIKQNLERRFLFPPETLFLLLLIWHPQPLQTRSYSGVQVTLELTNPPASASSVLKLQAYTITSGHLAGAENFQKENNIFFLFQYDLQRAIFMQEYKLLCTDPPPDPTTLSFLSSFLLVFFVSLDSFACTLISYALYDSVYKYEIQTILMRENIGCVEV